MKKIFRISISGFNKIYRWIFNQVIRIRWNVLENTLRMKFNLDKISSTIKISQTVAYLTPRFKERLEKVSSSFKMKHEMLIRTLERYKISTTIKLIQAVKELRIKSRILQIVFEPIKLGLMTATFQLKQFLKLRDWDYQIPDLPDSSPKWKLSELDGMKLMQMDEK